MRVSRILFFAMGLLVSGSALADTVRTLDGKIVDGTVRIDPKGAITVSPRGGGQPQKIDTAQLLRIRFDGSHDAQVDAGSTENWVGTDIGPVSLAGSHKITGGQLTVEASGSDIAGKADAFRFVSQSMAGSGDVSAKLTAGGQARPSMLAGVMLRATPDSDSAHAALLIARDGGVLFATRDKTGQESRIVAGGSERAPIWLRLVRKDELVTAFKSADGKNWSRVGSSTVDLGSEPMAGVAVASRDPGLCAAVFEKIRVAADEPTGSVVTPLNELKALPPRVKKPNLPKGEKPPQHNVFMVNGKDVARGVDAGSTFEIRYNIEGKYNVLVGDISLTDREKKGGAAKVEIFIDNDKVADSGKVNGSTPAFPFSLPVTGKRELRIVVTDLGEGKTFNTVDLRNTRLIVLSTVRQVAKTQTSMLVTVDGSTFAGVEVRSVTKDAVRFSRGDRRDLSVPADQIARIYMPGLTPEAIDKLPASATGVLMTNGDFYEGDIEKIADGKLQVNSIIFGPREFSLRKDVSALVLRQPSSDAKPAEYVVQSIDGSTFMAAALSGEGGKLAVTDRALGKLAMDLRSLREIRYGGDRLKWLPDLRPRRVDTAPNRSSAEGFLIDSTIFGTTLHLTGLDCDRGISLGAGTSVTYDLDGQYKTLLCVAGVPSDALPLASAVFIAEADGKELFRSPARNSMQDALPVSIDTSQLKTITFRVESDKGSSLPVVGLWGDPLLVKAQP